MGKKKTAILQLEWIKKSVIGVVEMRHVSDSDAANMGREGWKPAGTGWIYSMPAAIEIGREEQQLRGKVANMWSMAVVYNPEKWVMEADVLEKLPPEEAELAIQTMQT